ncbi:MAG: class I SAM-dependent methyltransferase [Planctomycetales bacterium]|nr:class I SAM-dependent methyltransferase [Planctomycetales bacterium]
MRRLLSLNPSRVRLREVNAAFARSIPNDACVLDAGAGEAPYRPLFAHTKYETADFEQVDKRYTPSTYVCDLADIPVDDARFDYIIFNQVMEHLPEPRTALAELFRVLKPGGKLLYTAPLCYQEHERPYDFYRYTRYAVKHLFTQAGFEFETHEWLEGYFATVGYHLSCMAQMLPRRPSEMRQIGIWKWVLFPVMVFLRFMFKLLGFFFSWLDLKCDYDARGYPKNYYAIVIKPADGQVSQSDPSSMMEHVVLKPRKLEK